MKRFLILSFFFVLCGTAALACADFGNTHNKYMFSVFRRECTYPAFYDDFSAWWLSYLKGTPAATNDWSEWNKEAVLTAAKYKHDIDMPTYVSLYDSYCEAAFTLDFDSWDYPSKQKLLNAKATVRSVLARAKTYSGKRLRPQYALLVMRCNMTLGIDEQNLAYWTAKASKQPASVWREMAENIYARALLKAGQRRKAYAIYARQGDFLSLKFSVRNYRNLAGIKSEYSSDPNSPVLTYLVQDFVNNAQETLDQKPDGVDGEEWIKTLGARPIYKDEVMGFISFADYVLSEGKTVTPCLWRTAQGMLYYLFGHNSEALVCLDKALSDDGTLRMKDNARCIRLLASTRCSEPSASYGDYLVKELTWLNTKISEEREPAMYYDNHYVDVRDRIIHRGLAPLYDRYGMTNVATMLIGMAHKYDSDSNAEYAERDNCSYSDWDEYFCRLDSLSPDSLASYYRYLNADKATDFERYVADRVYKNADYFNDLIGTKYLACGRWDEAAEWLSKVSMKFVNNQGISFYMSRRDFTVERWFSRQRIKGDYFNYDETADTQPVMTNNQKIEFCKQMSDLTHTYLLLRDGEQKTHQAYKLATLTCQASYFGDCWYLTHYGKSVSDTARVGELDYLSEAVRYLNVSKQSTDPQLRYKSLYALALLPLEPWFVEQYDADYNAFIVPQPTARQYKALAELSSFAYHNPQSVDSYTSKCDVLARFRTITSR